MIGRRCTVILAFLLSLLVAAGARADVYGGPGRTLQTDLMLTGAPQFHGAAFNGRGIMPMVSPPSLPTQFANGPNLYEYLGSNPWMRSDPLGLSWDPFDDVTQLTAEHLWSGLFSVRTSINFARSGARLARSYEQASFLWDEMIFDRDTGILFDLIGGPFFSTLCFEAGTPVVLADGTTQTIDRIQLGSAVFSTMDPRAATTDKKAGTRSPADPDAYDSIDPAGWRQVELRLDTADHGVVGISLLRPTVWIEAMPVDGAGMLRLPGLGVRGVPRVVSVNPCPKVEPAAAGAGIVTGTFVTERAPIVRVWCEGAATPIGATPDHPFYSLDRSDWVGAARLREGERIQTLDGSVRVQRVEPLADPVTVYNFEVHRSHTYYAGESRVWVHNECKIHWTGIARWMRKAKGQSTFAAVADPTGANIWISIMHDDAAQAALDATGMAGLQRLPRGWIVGDIKLDAADNFLEWVVRQVIP